MKLLISFALASIALFGQTTVNGGRTTLGPVDNSGSTSTKPDRNVTSNPATCSKGELIFNTTDTNTYRCTATNVLTQVNNAGAGITQLTGDVTAGPGTGSQATTLANSGVTPGSCGDATHSCSITTDVKGRVTNQSNNAISGGGGSVFTGSTAAAPAFSATPTFSLADVTVKSPVRVEPGAMTANVTSVTFTNKTAGAKFSLVWLQDGTGGRTVAYGASANNTCNVTPDANVATTQFLEVAADGATVNGVGCSDNSGLGKIVLPEGTAPAGIAASDIIYADSVAHRAKMLNNNGTADTVVGAATTDTLTNKTFDTAGTGNSLKINGAAVTDVQGNGAKAQLSTGTTTSGHCTQFDVNGNTVDAGAPCGGGGGGSHTLFINMGAITFGGGFNDGLNCSVALNTGLGSLTGDVDGPLGPTFAQAATGYIACWIDLSSWDGNALTMRFYSMPASGGLGGGTVVWSAATSCKTFSTTATSFGTTYGTASNANSYAALVAFNTYMTSVAIPLTGCTAGSGKIMTIKIKRATDTETTAIALTGVSITGVF